MAIGFFHDENIGLPHPPVPLAVYLILEEAVRVAWQRLRSQSPSRIDIGTATEDAITHELYEILFDEVYNAGLVDGFDKERFTVVMRESKLRNYDGTKLDKMPDLLVGIAARESVCRRSQDWIFIECKPIDSGHSPAAHYGSKGIERFLCGEYAWAMVDALMIGYSSAGYALIPKLVDMLRDRAKDFEVLEHPSVCSRSIPSPISLAVHRTFHRRRFNYVENGQPAPPIRLRHLWLNRN